MHNMGSSKWDKIIEPAEAYVMKREWNGKNHRFPIKSHIAKHCEANNDMVRASQHIAFELPNEHTRVGRLIKSITTKDPSIVSALTHIQGSPTQRNDFETAAEFLLLTAPDNTTTNTSRVSALRTGRGKGKRNGGNGNTKKGPETGVEVRYYKKSEYDKLSHEERKELSEIRKGNKDDNTSQNSDNATVAALKQQVSQLKERIIAALKTSETPPETKDKKKDPLTNPFNQRT